MAIHGVIRTDRMYGTDVAANLISVKYMGSGTTPTAIDNGNVVLLDGLMTGEREVYKGKTPAANSALDSIAIIATPEMFYDERKKNLEEFENEAGAICRAYRPHTHDIFSLTKEALEASDFDAVAAGDVVELKAGTKLQVVSSLTSLSTQVGKILAIETAGRYTYYVIEVV